MQIRIGKFQIRVYASVLEKRIGICSQKYDKTDSHILLWDFDYMSLSKIVKSLKVIQDTYCLPVIYVIKSSPDSYHAYCFTARTFRETITILSATTTLDITYLRMGIVRGYFTLRISPRKNEPKFKLVRKLWSIYPDEAGYSDMTINEYLTSNKGGKYKNEK